jgi:hypothetical protein
VDFDSYANGNFQGIPSNSGLYQNYPNELERPLLLSLMQLLWDRAEANGYAAHMTSDPLPNTPAHKILMHVGFGDHQVSDVAAQVEARTIGASYDPPPLDANRPRFAGRPPGEGLASFYGIPPITFSPFYDGSAIVFWDVGPLRIENGETKGVTPPPPLELPNRQGVDPHEAPRNAVKARQQKSDFLQPAGHVSDVCAPSPCYAFGYTGP